MRAGSQRCIMNTVDQIGPYRIIREIGRGGMGVVYLVEHPTLGIDVALKALFPDPSRSAQSREVIEARKRFENEAVITAKLPNAILPVSGCDTALHKSIILKAGCHPSKKIPACHRADRTRS